eukprot:2575333-Prymnesium_polylepis.2
MYRVTVDDRRRHDIHISETTVHHTIKETRLITSSNEDSSTATCGAASGRQVADNWPGELLEAHLSCARELLAVG